MDPQAAKALAEQLTQERDGIEQTMQDNADVAAKWEALAERLRGELSNMWGLHHGFTHKGHKEGRESCPSTSCQNARAAIDATPYLPAGRPEEAREKEGKR
jgi:hypothetical protein